MQIAPQDDPEERDQRAAAQTTNGSGDSVPLERVANRRRQSRQTKHGAER